MLVLARKTGQSVRIGETVTLKILECAAGHVRIGFAAPEQIRITRGEAGDRSRTKHMDEPVAVAGE